MLIAQSVHFHKHCTAKFFIRCFDNICYAVHMRSWIVRPSVDFLLAKDITVMIYKKSLVIRSCLTADIPSALRDKMVNAGFEKKKALFTTGNSVPASSITIMLASFLESRNLHLGKNCRSS